MLVDDINIKISEWCIPCGKKGYIAVKILDTDTGPHKSHCKINVCTNQKCFRYAPTIPEGWLDDKATLAYERLRAIHTASIRVQDKRESEKPQRKPYTESKAHQRPTMDWQGPRLRQLEDARPGRFPRFKQESSGISYNREDNRIDRKAAMDIKAISRGDGPSNPVGG